MSWVPIYKATYVWLPLSGSLTRLKLTGAAASSELAAWQLSLSATFTCVQHVTLVNSGLFNPQLFHKESEAFALNSLDISSKNHSEWQVLRATPRRRPGAKPDSASGSLNRGHPDLMEGP